MDDHIRDLVDREVAHASALLEKEPSFDNLADAAETLARAANRLAPEGLTQHSVRLVRSESDLPAIELAERLG